MIDYNNYYNNINEDDTKYKKAIKIINNIYGKNTASSWCDSMRLFGGVFIKLKYIEKIWSLNGYEGIEEVKTLFKEIENQYPALKKHVKKENMKDGIVTDVVVNNSSLGAVLSKLCLFFKTPEKLHLSSNTIKYTISKKNKVEIPLIAIRMLDNENTLVANEIMDVFNILLWESTLKNEIASLIVYDEQIISPFEKKIFDKEGTKGFIDKVNSFFNINIIKISENKNRLMIKNKVCEVDDFNKLCGIYNNDMTAMKKLIETNTHLKNYVVFKGTNDDIKKARVLLKKSILEFNTQLSTCKKIFNTKEKKYSLNKYNDNLKCITYYNQINPFFQLKNLKEEDFIEFNYGTIVELSCNRFCFKYDITNCDGQLKNTLGFISVAKDITKIIESDSIDIYETICNKLRKVSEFTLKKDYKKFAKDNEMYIPPLEEFKDKFERTLDSTIRKVFESDAFKINYLKIKKGAISISKVEFSEIEKNIDEDIKGYGQMISIKTLEDINKKIEYARRVDFLIKKPEVKPILGIINELTKKGRSTYISLLLGKANAKYKDETMYYGALSNLKQSTLDSIIDNLIRDKILTIVNRRASFGSYESIEITDYCKKNIYDKVMNGYSKAKITTISITELDLYIKQEGKIDFLYESEANITFKNGDEFKLFMNMVEERPAFIINNWRNIRQHIKVLPDGFIQMLKVKYALTTTNSIKKCCKFIIDNEEGV